MLARWLSVNKADISLNLLILPNANQCIKSYYLILSLNKALKVNLAIHLTMSLSNIKSLHCTHIMIYCVLISLFSLVAEKDITAIRYIGNGCELIK